LYNSINQIFELADKFGENNLFKDKSIVIDYSAPNAAKHLHAGHIRSTIIGHVLSNLYEVNGYTSHRVNHINDWGGFGFLIH
jgi:arginyl-tRNA synthetase